MKEKTSMPFYLTKAQEVHAEMLSEVMKTTFCQTYANFSSEQGMQAYVNEQFGVEQVLALIKNPDITIFLAFVGPELAGYSILHFNEDCPYLKGPGQIKFDKNYVLDRFQGMGVGKALFQIRYNYARNFGLSVGWLRVSHTNAKAIEYHQKNGFKIVGEKMMDLIPFPNRPYQDFDYIMYREIE